MDRAPEVAQTEAAQSKQADLLVARIDDYRALAYELGANPVERVIKNGRVIEGLGNG